jgi:subtilisin family serine protease
MRKHTARTAAAAGCAGMLLAGLAGPATAAPVHEPTRRYIVRTDSAAVTETVADGVKHAGGDVAGVYGKVLPGLSVNLTRDQAEALEANSDVTSVTPDQVFHATTTQAAAPWDLDRIDQRATEGNSTYRYDTTGAGVTAFLIDTGVRLGHTEFGGRAVSGFDFVEGDTDASDCAGHGTHVAGSIAGSTYGVAKSVKVVSVRALDCNGAGFGGDIIDALDWVTAHKPAGPAVVNLSLGGDAFPLLDQAVERTVAAGIAVVVAAGNSGADACTESPARAPHAITVAATTSADARPSWSNFGSCVDLFAPGAGIRSASNDSDSATEVMSGTSMAAPHVVGAAARYLEGHPTSTPAQTTSALLSTATADQVTGLTGSPDRLLYVRPPATAPGAPRKVAVRTNQTSRTATLRWAAPRSKGGAKITGYRVTRNGKDTRGRGPVTVTVRASRTSYTFKKLRKGSTYSVTVRAVNTVGAGSAVRKATAKLR